MLGAEERMWGVCHGLLFPGIDPNIDFALYKPQNWISVQNESFPNSEAQFGVELLSSQKSNPGAQIEEPLEAILAQLEIA
ncbi:hypothetical protein llap_13586 [Limosa lapponica baueri]|uniref:Uncharacterized protein n=1 Tax=Limosa lapponica baueri TaxID=1758121 RepID=A0A2I0TQP3_LIMLA|nr:hypothetical protein llap_13586 [Limosa lapponica baueri]